MRLSAQMRTLAGLAALEPWDREEVIGLCGLGKVGRGRTSALDVVAKTNTKNPFLWAAAMSVAKSNIAAGKPVTLPNRGTVKNASPELLAPVYREAVKAGLATSPTPRDVIIPAAKGSGIRAAVVNVSPAGTSVVRPFAAPAGVAINAGPAPALPMLPVSIPTVAPSPLIDSVAPDILATIGPSDSTFTAAYEPVAFEPVAAGQSLSDFYAALQAAGGDAPFQDDAAGYVEMTAGEYAATDAAPDFGPFEETEPMDYVETTAAEYAGLGSWLSKAVGSTGIKNLIGAIPGVGPIVSGVVNAVGNNGQSQAQAQPAQLAPLPAGYARLADGQVVRIAAPAAPKSAGIDSKTVMIGAAILVGLVFVLKSSK